MRAADRSSQPQRYPPQPHLAVLRRVLRPAYTTWPALTEAAHLVSEHLSVSVLRLVEKGRLEIVEITPGLPRMVDLMQRYSDLPMDLADASLVWAAEHTGVMRIVTLDRADFGVYRVKGTRAFEVLP